MRKRIEIIDNHLYDRVDEIRRTQGGTIAGIGRRLMTERLTQLESQTALSRASAVRREEGGTDKDIRTSTHPEVA